MFPNSCQYMKESIPPSPTQVRSAAGSPTMMDKLSDLSEQQREAVQWQEGALLVLAGSGAGKTRVLAARIEQLINGSPGSYFKILALTFTDKTAAEMREYIAQSVPDAEERTFLTTFHSFSASLLRQHGSHIGLSPDFTILSQDADRQALLDDAIERTGSGYSGWRRESLLPFITRLAENNISPGRAADTLRNNHVPGSEWYASVYKNYWQLMIERNSLDFAGLIAGAFRILQDNPGVKKLVQQVYTYICVDEFQDTNLSQYEMLCHIVNEKTKNLFVVADDDQIICQWNGANPERLRQLHNDFSMKVLQLPENYRCPAEVVELANQLISHNSYWFVGKDQLRAHKVREENNVITTKGFEEFTEEVQWVAADIAECPPAVRARCVVLARTRKLLGEVAKALNEKGIGAYLATRKNEFSSMPLVWLHSVLRLANSRNSREHLRSVCDAFYILEGIWLDDCDIAALNSAEEGDYLRGFVAAALGRDELSPGAKSLLQGKLLPVLADRLDFKGFQEAAFEWLDSIQDELSAAEKTFDEYTEEKTTWEQLVDEISDQQGGQLSLHQLLQELDLRSKSPEPGKDAVPCFTIHAAKGMEFDHVYLVGMVEDQLPGWAAKKKGDKSDEMEEERRNCFVAITRTQKSLTLTYSKKINGYLKKPSRFLYEMGVLRE